MERKEYTAAKNYTLFSFTGVPQKEYRPIYIEKADNIYVWDENGKEYIDLGSQLVNVNIGFGNQNIIKAIQHQVETLAYVAPKHSYEQRGELGEILIEEIAPKNMQKAFFTLGGSDANEFAIRIAKTVTGRDKIFSKYESYHGATYGAGSLTGEPDRASLFPTIPGFIKYQAPHLYHYDIEFATEEEATAHFLKRLQYQFEMEGPDKIAAFFIESVTGSNGVYLYPKGYLKGVRELCTKYGILMVCDEVMSGFLRCGEWFACQKEGIEPDIITFAKGVNSSYAPLGGVLISKEISEYFDNNPFATGLTYNAHPLGVAAAIACIREYQRLDIKTHVNQLAPILTEQLNWLKEKHISIGDVRSTGLFGAIEFSQNRETHAKISTDKEGRPFLQQMLLVLREYGLLTFGQGSTILFAPPLITTEEQLNEIITRLDKAIEYVDDIVNSI
ncbi:aminotransferase class III-fold pyridoxal phosphate-dependent enzyme [Scatolibacter rhodanostii]|uniref:aminotransferase class III-fold pyridoxal phosphate-dependent enzyme n=1 Tax=Scatolibacter rhodanostii TaxID=2014781 RepID=UPI000C082DD0|nr:aminotransferase class III-fold pyridoxal phosphate-dependent enzyme [Scatolibacter rhodanostii]